MFARRDIKSHALRIVDHATVSAKVHPAFVRIFRDDQASCSDETAAIELMHEWNRELEQINFVAGIHVLEDRAFSDHLVLDGLMGDELLAEGAHQV